jgi:hypothetical protein
VVYISSFSFSCRPKNSGQNLQNFFSQRYLDFAAVS